MNILDLVKEPHPMNTPAPVPTEKAQIVIRFDSPQPPCICRYSTSAKGFSAFNAVKKAWTTERKCLTGKEPSIYNMPHDMFETCVDLSRVISIEYVDMAKRNKFVPIS